MYDYMIGTIKEINSNNIVLETNTIGYLIYTSNPFSFEEGKNYKIYLYQQIKEDEHLLFGFKEKSEKEMFLKLIGVKGLGPKMALPILATGSLAGIKDAIERENILYLKKFPKIGDKLAKQMVLDLKGKLGEFEALEDTNNDTLMEVHDALLALGYKEKEIKTVLAQIDNSLSIENQIKQALSLFLK